MRVVVTREDLAERITELGHEPVFCPLIRIEPLGDDPIDPSAYDWVVVTSRNGAHELARRLFGTPKHLAAIGSGTAEALRERGLQPELVPRVSTEEGPPAALPEGRV